MVELGTVLPAKFDVSDYGDGRWILHGADGRHILMGEQTFAVMQALSRGATIEHAWMLYRADNAHLEREHFITHAKRCLDSFDVPVLPLRSLTARVSILSEALTARLAQPLSPLFRKGAFGISLFCSMALALGLLLQHWEGMGNAWNIEDARTVGVIAILLLLSAVVHELGHAAAIRARGQQPGTIGVGLYLYVIPVFFTDLSRAWRLRRNDRCVVNLGGIHLQLCFGILVFAVSVVHELPGEALQTSASVILLVALLQLSPLLRSDGYWLMADWLNEPQLSRIGWRDALELIRSAGRRRRGVFLLAFLAANTGMYMFFVFWFAKSCLQLTGQLQAALITGVLPSTLLSLRSALTILTLTLLMTKAASAFRRRLAKA